MSTCCRARSSRSPTWSALCRSPQGDRYMRVWQGWRNRKRQRSNQPYTTTGKTQNELFPAHQYHYQYQYQHHYQREAASLSAYYGHGFWKHALRVTSSSLTNLVIKKATYYPNPSGAIFAQDTWAQGTRQHNRFGMTWLNIQSLEGGREFEFRIFVGGR